jgi:hypothetical protein
LQYWKLTDKIYISFSQFGAIWTWKWRSGSSTWILDIRPNNWFALILPILWRPLQLHNCRLIHTFSLIIFKISVNGYLAFATVLDQGPTINVGPDSTDWPRVQDPAMIAPFLCKQQVKHLRL